MNASPRIVTLALVVGAVLATASLATMASPAGSAAPAAVSHESLYRIESSAMAAAWVRPDADFSGYRKIMLEPAGLSYREVRTNAASRSATDFAVTERQEIRLKEILRESFLEGLGGSERYEIVEQSGPDVLRVRGALVDIVSHVPAVPAGRGGSAIRSVGEATLVIEVTDSVGGQLLARAADRRAATSAFMRRSNTVNNQAEIRRAALRSATTLRAQLEELLAR